MTTNELVQATATAARFGWGVAELAARPGIYVIRASYGSQLARMDTMRGTATVVLEHGNGGESHHDTLSAAVAHLAWARNAQTI